MLSDLNHPSIARVLDAGHTDEGRPYLVMEYVDGIAIDQHAEALSLPARLRLLLPVCDAVSHAHRRLIVHRDLKPSNILVDSVGNPKLLDFGIAKLLDRSGNETLPLDRLLTPNYASPEQMRGDAQTTATDVYSLGAVLHKLVTGRTPKEAGASPMLPQDLDSVLRKALRDEPEERYASVDAFADDIRAFLESRPVQARSGNACYRTRKFLRRHWLTVFAAVFAIAGLAGGLWVAQRQRAIAQRRFDDVRQLSNRLFDIDRQVLQLPGGTRTRQLIVDTSLEYLRRLTADAQQDPDLALDVGTAYMRVGRVQGVPISPTLGQVENAERNLRIADGLIRSVLAAKPGNRTAFLRAAQIAHDRMVLAEDRTPDGAALPLAFQAEDWLNKYLASGSVDGEEGDQVLLIGINVANWYSRKGLPPRALGLARRVIALAGQMRQPRQVAAAQIVVARTLRDAGDLAGALAAARDAVNVSAAPPPGDTNVSWKWTLSMADSTAAAILGEDGGINLGRSREAADLYERGLRIQEDLARRDPNDAKARMSLGIRGIGLAGILRHSEPRRAIAVYDEVLQRLDEVKNNPGARRDEVRALAGSTYPLRRLGRSNEARRRLDMAFARLSSLKLYPAEHVEPGSATDDALRAQAEYEADNGNLQRGITIYQQLLDRIPANAASNLRDATALSSLYAALARLQSRARQRDAAASLAAQRLELWRAWARRLPNNVYVLRQLSLPILP
jgi:tetratricopeptide (TPR) repeat protein